jgi:hypothetical protein
VTVSFGGLVCEGCCVATELAALKLVHVACASIWFGASLLAGADVRRTLELGRPHADLLPERIRRLERLAIPSGVLTLLTGVALAAWVYGWREVPTRLCVILGLTLATMAVGVLLVSPMWRRVAAVIEKGQDLAMARAPADWFARSLWLEHALRLSVLALVVAR